jgi:hypothetical protein
VLQFALRRAVWGASRLRLDDFIVEARRLFASFQLKTTVEPSK